MADSRLTMSFRMDDGIDDELQFLCTELKYTSKNALLNALVRDAYHKFHDDPEITKKLSMLNEMTKTFEQWHKRLDEMGVPK